MRTFYFGCWRDAGHYLWHRGTDGSPIKMYDRGEAERRLLGSYPHSGGERTPGEIPWGYHLDGGLLNQRRTKQGEAVVEQRDGWTALSFWDYSVDSRGGSNSTFVFDELLEPARALELARTLWPPIFERFTFEVTLA